MVYDRGGGKISLKCVTEFGQPAPVTVVIPAVMLTRP